MVSSDEPRDDEEREGDSPDESVLPPGPRRSTYTPPTQPVDPISPLEPPSVFNDEELASAIAADLARVATGAVNVVYQLDDVPPSAPLGASVEPPVSVQPPISTDLPRAPEPAPIDPVSIDEVASLAQQSAPAGQPWIPQRRSLPDAELSAMLENAASHPGGTLGVMDELENQLRLREEETLEFKDWQSSMLAVGTPEALAAVEQVLPQFTDIVAPTTTSVPVAPTPSVAQAEPVAQAEQVALPTQEVPPVVAPVPNPENVFRMTAPVQIIPPSPVNVPLPEPWAIAEGTPVPDRYPEPEAPQLIEPAPFGGEPVSEPVFEPAPFDPEQFYPPPTLNQAAFSDLDTPVFVEPSIPVEQLAPFEPDPPVLVEPDAFSNTPFVENPLTGPVTGSVPVPVPQLDRDIDDNVDETDQAFDELLGSPPATATATVEPILSPRTGAHEIVLGDQELESPRAFSLERTGVEPTPAEARVGRAARMFWMWFAVNSSVIAIGFGALVFSLGMSLRQAVVGILAGIAISFFPLGLSALAGKRSGQPTMVVSRATFGIVGNGVPAILALVSRIFWGAVLLWVLSEGVAEILIGAELNGPLGHDLIVLISLAAGFVISLVVAIFGYHLIARIQLITSVIAGILIVGVIALTWKYVDIPAALTIGDGSWLLSVTAAVIVFSFIGLVWANSGADLARYQRDGSSGAGTMLWTTFGTAIPTFLLIAYGALLAASNSTIATGLTEHPFDTIGRMLPVWYPVPLLVATALSLLSGIIVSLYSGGFAVQAIGFRISRRAAVIVVSLLLGAAAFFMTTLVADLVVLFRDFATTLAVPIAAWAGIFAAETMIRTKRYDSESLLRRGGSYASVRWVNLVMLFVITGVGYALTTATVYWLSWQGYGFTLLGIPLDGELAGSDVGVFVALLLGLLTPIVAGIPAIRRQEVAATVTN
jgi:purine-cytosine permease-like protein